MDHPLGEETSEALAQAWLDYRTKVEEILDKHDDKALLAFAGNLSENAFREALDAAEKTDRMTALNRVGYRYHFARAKPVLDAGGVYCVFHGQDIRDCYKQGLHPDDD